MSIHKSSLASAACFGSILGLGLGVAAHKIFRLSRCASSLIGLGSFSLGCVAGVVKDRRSKDIFWIESQGQVITNAQMDQIPQTISTLGIKNGVLTEEALSKIPGNIRRFIMHECNLERSADAFSAIPKRVSYLEFCKCNLQGAKTALEEIPSTIQHITLAQCDLEKAVGALGGIKSENLWIRDCNLKSAATAFANISDDVLEILFAECEINGSIEALRAIPSTVSSIRLFGKVELDPDTHQALKELDESKGRVFQWSKLRT